MESEYVIIDGRRYRKTNAQKIQASSRQMPSYANKNLRGVEERKKDLEPVRTP